MYYEFYLDLYFLENFVMNSLVLYLTADFVKDAARPVRIGAAAAAGAAGSCLLLALPVHKNAAASAVCTLLFYSLMARIAFGGKDAKKTGARVLTAALTSLLLGAVCQFLMDILRLPFPAAVLAGYFLTRFFAGRWRKNQSRAQYLYDVTLQRGERSIQVKGFLDSGNRLVQPITARPVHIIDLCEIKKLLSGAEQEELQKLLGLEADACPSGKFSYIPYQSIGNSQGVLPAVLLDGMCVKHGESARSTKGVLVAVSKEAVSSRGEYQMILHPQILE